MLEILEKNKTVLCTLRMAINDLIKTILSPNVNSQSAKHSGAAASQPFTNSNRKTEWSDKSQIYLFCHASKMFSDPLLINTRDAQYLFVINNELIVTIFY